MYAQENTRIAASDTVTDLKCDLLANLLGQDYNVRLNFLNVQVMGLECQTRTSAHVGFMRHY